MVRNRVGWRQRVARLQGSPVELDLGSYEEALTAIAGEEPALLKKSDRELDEQARALGDRARRGAAREALLVPTFALAREVSRRVLGLRPFDEQIVAGLALDRGAIVEMQTGEGKTLAAVLPAALNALTGRGVHVLTFNDYLARRDAEWMGPIYRALGVSAAAVQQGMGPDERRRAYRGDVTYVTAKEAGFDHLRDLLATDAADLVHRPFQFAIVDEADSLLIDEARVPLVIAGSVGREASSAPRLAELVATLTPGVDYDTDEYARDVELTEAGIERVERALACGSLHDEANYRLLTELNCALHAHVLVRRDVDYIVRDGRLEIVDEFTGRVVPDRHWPDGLQAALEAKERLARRPDGRILGSVTLQHFLRGYARLSGMTGTARDAASELFEFYGLRTVVVPTHAPVIRADHPDVVFADRASKEDAVVREVRRAHADRRPVLVGTLTVNESERIADRLRREGLACEILNAKNDAMEARVIARAGALGAITISTNMAGRGTDIRLGGEDDADRARVTALGGLYVIGTARHESRRVDLQLRGRAGRQGDPGDSRFFVSLEDDLLVRYGIRSLIPAPLLPAAGGGAIDNPVVKREIARAQRIIEGQNLEIRRTLWRYHVIVEEQRRRVMERRQALVEGRDTPDVWRRDVDRHAALAAAAGEDAVDRAEVAVTLGEIDRAWRDHLAYCADVREGIHLVGLGGQDPLARFSSDAVLAFSTLEPRIDDAVLAALPHVRATGAGLDLDRLDIRGPSSTWTYLVNDDPFRNQIALKLMGPGKTSMTMAAAFVSMPLLILWALVERYARKRPRRQAPPS